MFFLITLRNCVSGLACVSARRHKTYITLIGSNLPPCCFMVEQRRLLKSNTAAAAARKNVASNKQLDGSGISASAHGESGNQR